MFEYTHIEENGDCEEYNYWYQSCDNVTLCSICNSTSNNRKCSVSVKCRS